MSDEKFIENFGNFLLTNFNESNSNLHQTVLCTVEYCKYSKSGKNMFPLLLTQTLNSFKPGDQFIGAYVLLNYIMELE